MKALLWSANIAALRPDRGPETTPCEQRRRAERARLNGQPQASHPGVE